MTKARVGTVDRARVFFSAGEASGDAYAAELAIRVLGEWPGALLQGVGQARSRAAGISVVVDSSSWGAVSVSEAVKAAGRVLVGLRRARRALADGPPGVLVVIDFGAFNVPLARTAKRLGWKVVYFVPPGSWRRGPAGKDLPLVSDVAVTPFEWNERALREAGAQAYWYGHPLKQLVAQTPIPEPREGVALLPGSRPHEVAQNLGLMAEVTAGMGEPLWLAPAPAFSDEEILRLWAAAGGRAEVRIVRPARSALAGARAAIVCSGTATLEAALLRCPHVIVYRGSRWMELEVKVRGARIDHIGLPNILLERRAVPEFVLRGAEPGPVGAALQKLLEDGPERAEQLRAFEEVNALCGGADALDRAAELISDLVRG